MTDWRSLTHAALGAPSAGRMKALVKATGHTNPVGDGNSKTGVPGTYRPVGASCPSTCPLLGKGCYAQAGRVNMQQRRALPLADSSARAALIAMVEAYRWGIPARLHVSGDFAGEDGKPDVEYLQALVDIGTALREHGQQGDDAVFAWTYTHFDAHQLGHWWVSLRQAGIVVRWSGLRAPWGAIVLGKVADPAAAARAQGATYCPAQAAKDVGQTVTCVDCTLCWSRDRLIAFRADYQSNPPADGVALVPALP